MSGEDRRPLTIIGLGLIGSSLGLALKEAASKQWEIVGQDRDLAVLRHALNTGVIDRSEPDLAQSVKEAAVVVIATPILSMPDIMRTIAPYLPANCIVTDTASTKVKPILWAQDLLPKSVDFIGGHPLAGKEHQGIENANVKLLRGNGYVVTPQPGAKQEAIDTILGIIEAIGAYPLFLEATDHDQHAAAVSHLPILISTAMFRIARSSSTWPDLATVAASGFRDLTRLASGDPTMAYDICQTNSEAILQWLDRYISELKEYRRLVAADSDELFKVFTATQDERAQFLSQPTSNPELEDA